MIAKKLGGGSAALVVAMMAVNGVNFGVNIWLASVLSPKSFGDISLMVTVLLVTGVLASILQLTTTVAVLDPTRDATSDVRCIRLLTNRIAMAGAIALAVASPQLTVLLQIENSWALLVMAAGLPVHLQLAVERGRLHGEMAFARLTATLLAEGAGRAVATVLAVICFANLAGLTIALNLGFFASYLICRPQLGRWSWCDLSSPAGHPPLRSVGLALVAVTVLTNVDLVVAKVMFDPTAAGGFAALTLAGRIVFFASWTTQQAVLPFVTAEAAPLSVATRQRLFVLGNVVLCAILVAAAWATADIWVAITYGTNFADLAYLVGPYALGTGLIAVVAGTAMLASVRRHEGPATALLVGVIALVGALVVNGGSVSSFVITRTAAVAVLSLVTWSVVVAGNRATQRTIGYDRLVVEAQSA